MMGQAPVDRPPPVAQSATCKGVLLLQVVVRRWKWCFDIEETTMPSLRQPSVVVIVLRMMRVVDG